MFVVKSLCKISESFDSGDEDVELTILARFPRPKVCCFNAASRAASASRCFKIFSHTVELGPEADESVSPISSVKVVLSFCQMRGNENCDSADLSSPALVFSTWVRVILADFKE